jgi:hypothetical protein
VCPTPPPARAPRPGEARLVLGRERVLVELRGRHTLGREEIERQHRYVQPGEVGRGGDFFTRQRSDDDVGTGHCAGEHLRDTLCAGVVDLHARPVGRRQLVVGGHEAIAHAQCGRGGSPGHRQQQRDVRPASRARGQPGCAGLSGKCRRTCLQVAIARCLLRAGRNRDRIQQAQRLLGLSASERELRVEQRLLGHLLRRERPLGRTQGARRVLGAAGGEIIARRVQQQGSAVRAAVLRGELLVDVRSARRIARVLEFLGPVDRGRQLASLSEARAAAEGGCCEHEEEEARGEADGHGLKNAIQRREARL